ncbi:amino acid adenylation domain-containing protein [Catellatospora methionotrophica]|uniref:amino acid adenylation domain-containing protein n=1 Tax=Catellatospora methionotrophica TaxID=121620 RepID=UPI00140DEFC7|nr:amino acid adenylation domain-containing protein [Catellatospora methionotrophica]
MSEVTLDQWLRRRVAEHPDRVALREGDRAWTYAALDAHIEQVAAALRASGLTPGELVAVDVPRAAGSVAAILGVLRAGGAYLPVDPAYPATRRAHLLDSSRARLHLACTTGDDTAATVRRLHDGEPAELPPGTAYVIYTSGSTGAPKGVAVTHGNVISLLHAAAQRFTFGPDEVWPSFHSYSFDVSVWEIWACLLHGGCLVVVDEQTARDPYRLAALLEQERVTVLNQVPTVFGALVKAALRSRPDLSSLRYVVLAGEAVRMSVLAQWRRGELAPGARLINMYGITETTVHSTFADVTDLPAGTGGATLVGHPMAHLRARLVDTDLREVPFGEPGEILLAGAGVAAGYLHRPELTAQRFLTLDGQTWYRSGDLAYASADGLWYIGRNDDQVKIRGFRIELGEVEAALRAAPGVDDCIVVAPANSSGQRSLVGFYTGPGPDGGEPGRALVSHLARHLPAHLVPATVVPAAQLPRTPSGKADRRRMEDIWLGRATA